LLAPLHFRLHLRDDAYEALWQASFDQAPEFVRNAIKRLCDSAGDAGNPLRR